MIGKALGENVGVGMERSEPLTITRNYIRPNRGADVGDGIWRSRAKVNRAESTVRALDITASTVARSSSNEHDRARCRRSRRRGLPAIFPSAVVAMFTSTKGRSAGRREVDFI